LFSSPGYGVCVAVGAVVATGLVVPALGLLGGAAAVGCVAVVGVMVTPVTAPFTAFFCLLDDVGIGRRGDSALRYRMRDEERGSRSG
jgi:hypothetical protein